MNITTHFTEFICPKTFKLFFLNFPSNHIICKYAVTSFLIVISHFFFFIALFRTFKTVCSDSNNNRNTFFFLCFFKNWSMVDLQCYVSSWCREKWLGHTNIYIAFHILFHYGLSQDIEHSSLCYTIGPCCLSVDYFLS